MTETDDAVPTAETAEVDSSDDPAGLDDLPVGSGCAEIWDYLSERRRD